jgi:hypothetical protein
MQIIIALLALTALYGYGMWTWVFVLLSIRGRSKLPEADRAGIELYTFHLGICATTAIGFLGLIFAMEGH